MLSSMLSAALPSKSKSKQTVPVSACEKEKSVCVCLWVGAGDGSAVESSGGEGGGVESADPAFIRLSVFHKTSFFGGRGGEEGGGI